MFSKQSYYQISRHYKWLHHLFFVVLCTSIIGVMTVRGLTNKCLILLTLLSLCSIKRSIIDSKLLPSQLALKSTIFTLAVPVLALLFSQSLRQNWLISAYDGPARMLVSISLLFYVVHKKINFSWVIGLSAPLAIMTTLISIHLHPEVIAQWHGRYATTFVDPNAFGALTVIFTGFCLFNLNSAIQTKDSLLTKMWFSYQLLGFVLGLYLVMGSGTRGSWLAIPILAMLWVNLNHKKISRQFGIVLGLLIFVVAMLIVLFFPHIFERLVSGFSEINLWLQHGERDTSAGIRLSMWHISWDLFVNQPIWGYGDKGFQAYLNAPFINLEATQDAKNTIYCCGPHNELLANALRSGMLGIISVLCLLLVPLCIFIRKINHYQPEIKLAAELGLVYLITLIVSSLSMEVFNLKYTSSFYGLIIAGLVGQVLTAMPKTAQKEW